ncbi:MAG: hypothetical protein Fur0012_08700 [Elusimicrobiota bacterium]
MNCPICEEKLEEKGGLMLCPSCEASLRIGRVSYPELHYDEPRRREIYIDSQKDVFAAVVNGAEKHIQQKGRWLDVGCACGSLLEMVQEKGWEACGIEPSAELAAAGRGFDIQIKPFEQAVLKDNYFEIISMISVLYLFENPLKQLVRARLAMKPGGILILREYNASFHSLLRRLDFLWSLFGFKPYIVHNFNFTRKTLETALKRAGFEIVEFLNSPLTISDPYKQGHLVPILKKAADIFSRLTYYLSFGKILTSSSFLIFARKKEIE